MSEKSARTPLSSEEIEKLPGEYGKGSDAGFYHLTASGFYDPDGYYFDENGYDAFGGYYDQNEHGVSYYVDPDKEYQDNKIEHENLSDEELANTIPAEEDEAESGEDAKIEKEAVLREHVYPALSHVKKSFAETPNKSFIVKI